MNWAKTTSLVEISIKGTKNHEELGSRHIIF